MVVPDGVAVDDADGAVHLADGDDGTPADGVGVFAEGGGRGGGVGGEVEVGWDGG